MNYRVDESLSKFIDVLNRVAAPHLQTQYGYSYAYFDLAFKNTGFLQAGLTVKYTKGGLPLVASLDLDRKQWDRDSKNEPQMILKFLIDGLNAKIQAYGKIA